MRELAPYRRRRRARFSAGEIRLALLGGLLLGLAATETIWPVPSDDAPLAPPPIEASDPYAEARRSRAILEAQEDAPEPLLTAERGEESLVVGAVRVIDGDTFEVGGLRVRIADIDTPEVDGRCRYETELAAKATRRMRALLTAGPFQLHAAPDGRDEDRYGRKLRIVTRGGRSLGDVLVGEGLARTWTGRREPWCGTL